MVSLSERKANAWISSLRNGEISKVLADVSFIEELNNGANETIALNSLCILSSKIYKLRKFPKEKFIVDSTTKDVFKLSELCCVACQNIKITESQANKFLVALYHIIDSFMEEGYYDFALLLKEYIFIFGYGKEYKHKDERIATLLRNLFLKFWNCSIMLEKNESEETVDMYLDLRFGSIEILCCTGLSSLPTVSDRFMLTSQKCLLQSKEKFSQEKIIHFFRNILGIMIIMVNDVLKQETLIEEYRKGLDAKNDWSVLAFKPFCEVLTEIVRVYNIFGKGNEGLEMCDEHCRKLVGSEKPRNHFCEFLGILQEMLSRIVTSFGKKIEHNYTGKSFNSIYLELYDIQNYSEKYVNDSESKIKFEEITFKSLSFITATESICRALVNCIPKQNELTKSELSDEDRLGLLKLLKLSAELNFEFENDISTSLKAIALSMIFILQGVNDYFEKENLDSSNDFIIKAKEALNFGLKIEEKAPTNLSYKWKVAINLFFQSIHNAMEIFINRNCFEACEIFIVEYYKLALRWQNCPEFSNLKNNLWWGFKCLCVCRSKQEKFREALSALALAVKMEAATKYLPIFKEWVKVKIKAQLSKKDDQLKLSTIYHLLKENVKDEEWCFTEKDICHLLKLEIYAYTSKDVYLNDAIKDACHTVLEISNDAVSRAEAELCLIELFWQETLPCDTLIDSWKASEKDEIVDRDISNLKYILNLCEKLVCDLKKEIVTRKNSAPEDDPVILCLIAHAYYWMFLCLAHIKIDGGQKELSKLCWIPLKALKNEEVELGEGESACDVAPAQQSLKSSKQSHLLCSSLNIALSLWEKALVKGLDNSNYEVFSIVIMLKCIETAAHIYELYDDLAHTVMSWSLLCQYADICNNDEAFLLGASNLMRIEIVSLNESFLKKAADVADKIGNVSPSLLSYWLGKSWLHLLSRELPNGLDYLKKVLNQCNPRIDSVHSILYAQAKHLLAIYCVHVAAPSNLVPTELSADPIFIGSGPRDSAISAIGVLVRLLEDWNKSESLANYFFAQSLLLNISAWLGELFLDLNSPREAYGFLREQFLLVQKLLLPNRAVWFLSLLAQADMMCRNMTDCEVKLNGMEMIMDLKHRKEEEAVVNLENLFEELKIEDSVNRGGKMTFKTCWEASLVGKTANCDTERKVRASEGSSHLNTNNFNPGCSPDLPRCSNSFTLIPPECEFECLCPWCVDSGFQKAFLGMVLVKVWVLFESSQKDFALKVEIPKCGEKLIKEIINRRKKLIIFVEKCSNRLPCMELDNCVKDASQKIEALVTLQIFYVRFLLNMVDCYTSLWEATGATNGDLITASETGNGVALEELRMIKSSFQILHLRARATLQKVTVSSIKKSVSFNPRESKGLNFMETNICQQNSSKDEGWKTPVRNSGCIYSQRIDLGDDDEVNDDPVPTGRVGILPCFNLDAKLKEEEEETKEKEITRTVSKSMNEKQKEEIAPEIAKKEKSKEAKKERSHLRTISTIGSVPCNDESKSTCISSWSKEEQSSTAIEGEDFICDSPNTIPKVSKYHKKKALTAKPGKNVQKITSSSSNITKQYGSKSAVASNASCKCLNSRGTSKNENSAEELLSSTAYPYPCISEGAATAEDDLIGNGAELEENSGSVADVPSGEEGKHKAVFQSIRGRVKQTPARRVRAKNDTFIDDSEAILIAKNGRVKKLPKNIFLR